MNPAVWHQATESDFLDRDHGRIRVFPGETRQNSASVTKTEAGTGVAMMTTRVGVCPWRANKAVDLVRIRGATSEQGKRNAPLDQQPIALFLALDRRGSLRRLLASANNVVAVTSLMFN